MTPLRASGEAPLGGGGRGAGALVDIFPYLLIHGIKCSAQSR